tara:strand:+ start:672 stop:1862 length:1191 start_codon:yes stop_codon:yes gene_type:complete
VKHFFLIDPKLLLFGFLITFFSSYGQTFFISIFNLEIRNYYELSDGGFGLIYALATLSSSFILIWFAKLIDKIDLRIYSIIICGGLALACFGMFYSYESIFYLFLIIFSLRFFGQGAMGHAGDTTLSRYFGLNRGKALSVGNLGVMFGFMIFPLITVYTMKNFNWHEVWFLSTITIIAICIPIIIISLVGHEIRHKKFKVNLENKNELKNKKNIKIIFDKKFYIYLPVSIASPFISTGLQFHQIFIINEKGWTLELLAESFVFLGFFSIIGLIFGGPIVDKFETKKVVIFSLAPLLLSIFVLYFFNNQISIFIYMSLLGLNLGLTFPSIGSLWAELWGLENLGSIKAILHSCGVFASALAPVLFGLFIDLGFGMISIFTISLFIILISIFLPLKYN